MSTNGAADVITIDDKKYRRVREGLASVLAPYGVERESTPTKQVKNNDEGNQAVFYNPIQQFNRDLTVLAITIYGEGAVLDKTARFSQKFGKSKREKKKQQTKPKDLGQSNEEPVPAQENSRKRKADDFEEQIVADDTADPAKRPRVDEALEGEDDLPVTQLNGGRYSATESTDINSDQKDTISNLEVQEMKPTTETPAPRPRKTPFTILDALSATGLRAFRYAKEIPFATNIVANDLSLEAVRIIETNIDHNEVKGKVHSNLGDARSFMYSKVGNEHQKQSEGYVHRFDVVDLDPYGTAVPFFDASLQSIHDGGMLCVTCTDAGVFASTGYPEKTYALYGGLPVKGPHSHEGGLRLILNAIATSAAKYGLAIEPLLSLYIDYYARLFVRVHKRPQDVKLLPGTTMAVYSCGHGCGSWTTQPLLRNQLQKAKNGDTFYKFSSAQAPTAGPNCDHCGSKTHLCGPMWAGPLHHPYFVKRMLDRVPTLDKSIYGTVERLQGMLTLALEEDLSLESHQIQGSSTAAQKHSNSADPQIIPRMPPAVIDPAPFFIMPTSLAKVIHCVTPPEDQFRGAIRSLGYRVSRSHCKAGSMKTNAPWNVLWEIMREYMRTKSPIKDGAVKKGTPGWNILARLRGTERNFVSDLKDSSKIQISRCESKEDLKIVLQGLLYRLGNETVEDVMDKKEPANMSNTANGDEVVTDTTVDLDKDSPQLSVDVIPSKLKIVFDGKLGKEQDRGKLVRYQINPRENWGPMNRAGRTAP
ncbi:uncharacterized protein A1O9_04640 [Exophiala aquamarina CBS 119918]|uniref:tRNA (guanine(26)-N(2))-dimethyltransferase n=1 Tax=Exophiala aquamarina CBS 119918 TaxID=1182545 RepID=A0A072PJA2_9EURO|nr:uncharacterized protein A1O9_04640 [Exophiala aquamarina CBS 119918]KEF59792.1 hypothetical protein A1O9_04640 [Exophiala aquamarina CBS 119918]